MLPGREKRTRNLKRAKEIDCHKIKEMDLRPPSEYLYSKTQGPKILRYHFKMKASYPSPCCLLKSVLVLFLLNNEVIPTLDENPPIFFNSMVQH